MSFYRKILKLVFYVFILISKSEENKILNDFFLCDKTDEIVPQNFQDLATYDKLSCEIFKNDLEIFSKCYMSV